MTRVIAPYPSDTFDRLADLIAFDEFVRRVKNNRTRPVILFHTDHSAFRVIIFETKNIFNVCSPPSVNGLIRIPYNGNLAVFVGKECCVQVAKALKALSFPPSSPALCSKSR